MPAISLRRAALSLERELICDLRSRSMPTTSSLVAIAAVGLEMGLYEGDDRAIKGGRWKLSNNERVKRHKLQDEASIGETASEWSGTVAAAFGGSRWE
jgi:hypothetical protein